MNRCPQIVTPPPSWTFMRIEEAAPAQQPAQPGAREAVAVLLWALADVVRLWWARYVRAEEARG